VNDFINELRKPEFPPQSAKRLLGEELERSLAGLAFNVPAEKGMELLLSSPIYNSLAKGEHEGLRTLIEKNERGTLAILEGVISARSRGKRRERSSRGRTYRSLLPYDR
jgi:hypothetical protein